MNFFKRRNFLKKANLLELTPVRLHEHVLLPEDQVVLLVEKFKNRNIAHFMLGRKSPHFRIRLDALGSAVWLLIDGGKQVTEIIAELNKRWIDAPEKKDHLEERLAGFMGQLYDNRYISFKEILEVK